MFRLVISTYFFRNNLLPLKYLPISTSIGSFNKTFSLVLITRILIECFNKGHIQIVPSQLSSACLWECVLSELFISGVKVQVKAQ